MAGYTYNWECRICTEKQETISDPKLRICDKCLKGLANALCTKKLLHSVDDPGIDSQFWFREAEQLAKHLFKRWQPRSVIQKETTAVPT